MPRIVGRLLRSRFGDGVKTGEVVTQDARNVAVLRIDGADELDWLLTLGAVERTEDAESLRKGGIVVQR